MPNYTRKHQVFGKIVGPTIYNFIKMNDFSTNSEDVPFRECIIEAVKVLEDPFKCKKYNNLEYTNTKNEEKPISDKPKQKKKKLCSFSDDLINKDNFKKTSLHDLEVDPGMIKESPKIDIKDISSLKKKNIIK